MHKTKRLLSFLLAVLMLIGMLASVPFTASAAAITYKTAAWNGSEVVIGSAAAESYTVVTPETTTWTTGTYVVNSDVTLNSRIGVSGTVNLILCDAATLTISQGICVSAGNTLNIFAQSFGEQAGALNVPTGGSGNAGIGSNYNQNCGTITINGGNLQIVGGNMSAGIGGGNLKPGGTITIYAGNITATGGNPDNVYGNPHGGAGIGGGSNGSGGAGRIAIYGGHVKATATGNNGPAAVGGGYARGSQGPVTIADGMVVLTGANAGSAKPCFDYPTHRGYYAEIWPHAHSLSFSASDNVITAVCANLDGCNCIDNQFSLTLNAPDKIYDGTDYSNTSLTSDSFSHDAVTEFNLATGLNVSLDSIEYEQNGTKLSAAPAEVGSYTAKLTMDINGTEYAISKDFNIIAPYRVIIGETENCTVTVDPTRAKEGDTITVTAVPDADCVPGEIKAFKKSDESQQMPLTALSGSATESGGYKKLVDGNTGTKWPRAYP